MTDTRHEDRHTSFLYMVVYATRAAILNLIFNVTIGYVIFSFIVVHSRCANVQFLRYNFMYDTLYYRNMQMLHMV